MLAALWNILDILIFTESGWGKYDRKITLFFWGGGGAFWHQDDNFVGLFSHTLLLIIPDKKKETHHLEQFNSQEDHEG